MSEPVRYRFIIEYRFTAGTRYIPTCINIQVNACKERGLKQQDAAKMWHISQPRVSALLKGKIEEFRLDTLVDLVHRLGLHVSLKVSKAA